MSKRPTVQVTVRFPGNGLNYYSETDRRPATDKEWARFEAWDKRRKQEIEAMSKEALRPIYETLRARFERSDGVDQ